MKFVVAFILLGFHAIPAFADKSHVLLRLPEDRGPFVKWGAPRMGAPATISYHLVERATELSMQYGSCGRLRPLADFSARVKIAPDVIETEVVAALQAWSEVAGVTFTKASTPEEADVLIGTSSDTSFMHARVALNRGAPVDGITPLLKATICLAAEKLWTLDLSKERHLSEKAPAVAQLRKAITHELGHVLGLDHTWDGNQLMHMRGGRLGKILQNGDINGARILYGPATPR